MGKKTRSVKFKLPSEIKAESGALREKKSSQEMVDSKTKRHRTMYLFEVRVKLRILHTKQIKYEEKAEEYRKKRNQKEEEKYQKAANAAKGIYNQVARLVNRYVQDGNLVFFKSKSQEILHADNVNVKTLRTYRGWWEKFLDDLAVLINAGFAHVGSSIRVHDFSLFKPATTDGGNKITELSNAINSLKV